MCATWKEIPCTLWQKMVKDSMTYMINSDLISYLWKIWHYKAKNSHQEVEFGIYRQPFELGKELEHERGGQVSYELLNHEDELEESHRCKFNLRRPHEVYKRISWGRRIYFNHFLIGFWHFWRAFACPLHSECSLSLLMNQFQGS